MASTGFLNIDGNDLINLYYGTSDTIVTTNFTGSNTFNGSIIHKINIIAGSSITYTSANVPNFAQTKLNNQAIAFTLPTTGVPDGFILYFRRNSGIQSVTYTFSPNIINQTNGSVSSFATALFSFSLIKYNNNWWILHPPA